MRLAAISIMALLLAAGISGCRKSQQKTVNAIGSTSIQPFAELLAEEFNAESHEFKIEVQGGGSTAGIQALNDGLAQVGMCSRSLDENESKTFTPITIARDGLAMVVNPANKVSALTRTQIKDIYSGKVTNWKQVGGDDRPIQLIVREEGSGTYEAFLEKVMGSKKARVALNALVQESNGAVKELVRNDPAAIGFMSLGLVGNDLKALKIDGVAPSAEEVVAGKYPLVRPFLFVTKRQVAPEVREFIDYVLSPKGQETLEKEGLVRAK